MLIVASELIKDLSDKLVWNCREFSKIFIKIY